MNIKIALFASARDLLGESEVELEFSELSTVADLRQALIDLYPQLGELVKRSAISVDHEFSMDSTPLSADSEVALIPPVSGG